MDYGVMRRNRQVTGVGIPNWRDAERRQDFEKGRKAGMCEECDRMRREAITAGVAEYVIVDPLTGRTEFRWKSPA